MPASVSIGKEMEHITQVMYQRNLELAERNKTLLILRKIEEIILSSVTDIEVIAQEVSNIVLKEAGFKGIFLRVLNHNRTMLNPLSIVFADSRNKVSKEVMNQLSGIQIALNHRDNVMVKTIKLNKPQRTNQFYFLEYPYLKLDKAYELQQTLAIKFFLVYPLVIREKPMGVMTIAVGKNQEFDYENRGDLLSRLPRVVSIALENALLYQTIQKNNERLKELDKLKDEFVSIASHELRTPMTAIKSYLWLALNKPEFKLDRKLKGYLQIAYSSTENLIKLVGNMLTVSRIEGKRLSMNIQKSSLTGLIKEVYNELIIRAKEQQIHLVFVQPKKDIFIMMDKDKIHEVLQNLLGNALKFTPEGGTIQITIKKNHQAVETSISDTGPGMSHEDQKKLFKKFSMLGASYAKTHNASGTGLGLFITKQIIEMHKGRITVQSEKGKGSTFTFSLPL